MHQNDTKQPVTKVKLIVGTTNGHAAISVAIKQAGQVADVLLKMVEMAFRAYGPCYTCATHTSPLEVSIYNSERGPLRDLRRPLSDQ